jgi:hypothetical protein
VSGGSPAGSQLLLAANGNIVVNQWKGAGYTRSIQTSTSTTTSISVTQKISGGLSGGFSGDPVDTSDLADSTQQEINPPPATANVSPAVFANDPAPTPQTISDPVDSFTGALIYQHTDLTTGGGSFPYALPFARTYVSASNLVDVALGKGWTHNFNVAASRSSTARGMGLASCETHHLATRPCGVYRRAYHLARRRPDPLATSIL